jgi:hypothetical protein
MSIRSNDDRSKLTCAHNYECTYLLNKALLIHLACTYSFISSSFFLYFQAPVMTDDTSTAYICIYCPFNSNNLEALENHLTSIN